jgi:rhodanese-related sulfurtransferase
LPQARPGQQWIIVCTEGYTSSLAADSLNALGIVATDIVGGFEAWRRAGLPTVRGWTPADQVVAVA